MKLLAGIILGVALVACGTTPTTITETTITAPMSDQEKMAEWWDAGNSQDWNLMIDRLTAIDLEGAVAIANDIDPMPVPALNEMFLQFQGELNTGLLSLNAGDIEGATAHVKRSTAIMEQLTASLNTL